MNAGKLARHVLPLAVAAILSAVAATGAGAQAPAPQTQFNWQDLGARVYGSYCSLCHQQNGQGVVGGFPPLADHAAEIFGQKNGRDYLIRTVLFGLEGMIVVKGNSFNGIMPSWAQLGDSEIAAALDHILTSWGNDKQLPRDFMAILPSEIAAARAQQLNAAQVHALRQQTLPGMQQGNVAESNPGRDSQQPAVTFTAEQVESGRAAYLHNCQDCHGTTLDNGEFGGPVLKGSYFRSHWAAGSVAALFSFTKARMPPDRPGGLSPQTYVDLTAFILSHNGYAPGDKELPSELDALQNMSLKK